MSMSERELRLDGNAAAGLLGEVFSAETTAAVVTCAACGAEGAVGSVHMYARGPGTVLRCPGCSAVLMRFARVHDRVVADLRGVGLLSHRSPAER
jgi:ribosomal protein S27E